MHKYEMVDPLGPTPYSGDEPTPEERLQRLQAIYDRRTGLGMTQEGVDDFFMHVLSDIIFLLLEVKRLKKTLREVTP